MPTGDRFLGGGWLWAIATGVLYGLLLNTKHNSWLLPPALIVHFVVARGEGFWRELRTGRVRAPLALIAMAVIGPAVFYALWPWIWHDTGKRLAAYVAFHTGHEYYNMEFLGRTYWKPPMPLGYAWVMTAATVPAITLLLFVIGLAPRPSAASACAWERGSAPSPERLGRLEASASSPADRELFSTELLWLGCILTSYAPWISKSTPIFGGTKHWITAYPFMALFAAQGFVLVGRAIVGLLSERRRLGPRRGPDRDSPRSAVAAPIAIAIGSHPWGLGAYTPLVGGAPGGRKPGTESIRSGATPPAPCRAS